ncbi:MAG: hypothetical protein Ct9H90mP21_0340 [Methanobacteriota archaeon]|nr:MAG: hypothetical protein Ct9H90mP21_0340 [Euryarchaeota archaeon]
MQGNLAPGPDGAFTHIHIVASDDDHVVRGGHLFEATVEVTAEIHMRVLDEGGCNHGKEKRQRATSSGYHSMIWRDSPAGAFRTWIRR